MIAHLEHRKVLNAVRNGANEQQPLTAGEVALLLDLPESKVTPILCKLMLSERHLHRKLAPRMTEGRVNRYAYWYDSTKRNPHFGKARLSNRRPSAKQEPPLPVPWTPNSSAVPSEPLQEVPTLQEFKAALTAVNSFLAHNSDVKVKFDGQRFTATLLVEKEL